MSEISLITEWRRTWNCTEPPFLNTSVFANVPKQRKNIFMRFNLHASLNVCFKFTFNRIFRKVKKYSIISILLNKPFSFALYMLCIIWVHVKEADLIILPSVVTARRHQGLQKNHIAWKKKKERTSYSTMHFLPVYQTNMEIWWLMINFHLLILI